MRSKKHLPQSPSLTRELGLIIAATPYIDLLFAIGSIAGDYFEWSKYFGRFPGLQVIILVNTFLRIGLIGFGIYAGIGLWSIRPGAVQMAKRFLLCILGYNIANTILPFMAGLPVAAFDAMIKHVAQEIFRTVIFFAIWYSYLNNSKRVKATYGL